MTVLTDSTTKYFVSKGLKAKFFLTGAPAVDILDGWKLKDVTVPGVTVEQQEVTSQLGSGYKEYVPSLADSGELSIVLYYNPEKDPVPAFDLRSASETSFQGMLKLFYQTYDGSTDDTPTEVMFYKCAANIASCGDLPMTIGSVVMTTVKFKQSGPPEYSSSAAGLS